MKRPLRWFERFWETDWGLTALLACLVTQVFFVPWLLHENERSGTIGGLVFFSLALLTGVRAVPARRTARAVRFAIVGVAIVIGWTNVLAPRLGLNAASNLAGIAALGLLTLLVLTQVFREGPITVHRVLGAVAVYLLLGISWALLYDVIATASPGAFRFPEEPTSFAERSGKLVYFSFVTLTTMGYGDITPVHPFARSAAILEALTGQLFPAILIARLVAMELMADGPARRPR